MGVVGCAHLFWVYLTGIDGLCWLGLFIRYFMFWRLGGMQKEEKFISSTFLGR